MVPLEYNVGEKNSVKQFINKRKNWKEEQKSVISRCTGTECINVNREIRESLFGCFCLNGVLYVQLCVYVLLIIVLNTIYVIMHTDCTCL